ncbi:MAG: ATP-binding protein [Acidimicrobiales bacterium]
MGPFVFDPFSFYSDGTLTNTNMLILGEPGWGKSASTKVLIYRSIGVLRSPGGGRRWAAIADPKGEYEPLARALGLDVVRLYPGGATRINPFDTGPGGSALTPDELALERTIMATTLIEAVMGRPLRPLEDGAVGWAVAELSRPERPLPVLADLALLLASPTAGMAAEADRSERELAAEVSDVRFSLGKLLNRQLRGMFDGRSTVSIDWSGRGLVLDLSAVFHDRNALRLVMIATNAWLQALLARPEGPNTPRRLQVWDEAWALLGDERTAQYAQRSWKLCRAYGVANIAVAHRLSDLRSQADDGTSTAKLAAGLLPDTQTRIVFRQATDQVAETARELGLNSAETFLLSRLGRGRALWKLAGRTAVVQHVIGAAEWPFCNTDSRLVV